MIVRLTPSTVVADHMERDSSPRSSVCFLLLFEIVWGKTSCKAWEEELRMLFINNPTLLATQDTGLG